MFFFQYLGAKTAKVDLLYNSNITFTNNCKAKYISPDVGNNQVNPYTQRKQN